MFCLRKSVKVAFLAFAFVFSAVGTALPRSTDVKLDLDSILAERIPSEVFAGYKGISLGATTATVREKLGEPKDKSDAMDLYVFSDSESAQFFYGPTKMVTAIMITYSGDLKKAPTAKDVFGEDVTPKSDGGIFKMVRYPKAGYWISYNRTAGDDAIVSIAMQKI